jgi:ATP-binding cassette subfamily B protein
VTTRLRNALAHLVYLPRTLRLIWEAAPLWTAIWAILLVIQGALPVALIYLMRELVNSLTRVINLGGVWEWETAQPALILVGIMAAIVLFTQILQSISTWISTAQSELVQDHINGLIHAKSATVDLAFYESAGYHDHMHRARSDAGTRSLALLDSSGSMLQSGMTMLSMVALLIPYGFWLPLVLVVSTLPALLVVFYFNRRHHRWWEQTTPDRRWAHYYDTMLTSNETAPELRLFGLGSFFQGAYQTTRRRLRSERLKLVRDQGLAQLGAGIVSLLIIGATMAWMVWRALQGLLTLGDLTLLYQAFNWGQGLMQTLLRNVGQIYSNTLFLSNLFAFLRLDPEITDPDAPQPVPAMQTGMRFRNVSFRYPGSERMALQNFDFTIPAGQTVAIVGANGAGKSTLLKLLCRFYDPEAGSIEVDGIDIRQFAIEQYQRQISVLFQTPVRYHATAAENIALSDRLAGSRHDMIEAAAHGAGVHSVIARLPRQYDTLLGKQFANGTDLSGGEWQRLALARAFLRQSQLVILDEPTSAMDSWAEAEWLDRFRDLVCGRTAVIITHRFTTAMRADVIHVMDAGQIVESGTHEALLAQGGLYAQSWNAQTQANPDLVMHPVTPDGWSLELPEKVSL